MPAFDEQDYTKSFQWGIWKRLMPVMRPYRRDFAGMFAFNLITAAIDVVLPLFQRYAISNYIEAGTLSGLLPYTLCYFGVILLQALSVVAFARNSMKIEMCAGRDMRANLFTHLQTLSFSFYNVTPVGYSQGRRADFSNTIILLTSNLGARCLSGQTSPLGFGAAAAETQRRGQQAIQEAKEFFRPELMGRLDETVLFDPLGPEQLAGIADRLLVELEQRAARQGYTLHHTPAAAKVLAGDKVPPYGARELRRTVSRAVEQALADRIAAGTAHPGTVYTADVDADGHIILTEDTLAACV